MPLPTILFPGDEELGKRDDDYKQGMKSPLGLAWQQRRMPHPPRRRSLLKVTGGILFLVALYYFFKNMPTDLEPATRRPHYNPPSGPNAPSAGPPPVRQGATPNPNHSEDRVEVVPHDFNGPIKFYQLAATLHAVSRTKGDQLINNNVVGYKPSISGSTSDMSLAFRRSKFEKCCNITAYSM